MDYQVLVDKIVDNPILQTAISKIIKRTNALNLVQSDWKNVLQNNQLYQSFEKGKIRFSKGHHVKGDAVFIKNIIGMQNNFNIVVAGYWSLGLPDENTLEEKNGGNTIICRLSTPLNEIGKVMMENDQQKLHDNCKFFIETCNPKICSFCRRGMQTLNSYDPNSWCIFKTKLFNGDSVKNHFRNVIEDTFGGSTFAGVLHLNITSRYTFGDNSLKIAGTCREMILFKETALDPMDELDIDYPIIENFKSIPSITLPPDDQMIIEGIPKVL